MRGLLCGSKLQAPVWWVWPLLLKDQLRLSSGFRATEEEKGRTVDAALVGVVGRRVFASARGIVDLSACRCVHVA